MILPLKRNFLKKITGNVPIPKRLFLYLTNCCCIFGIQGVIWFKCICICRPLFCLSQHDHCPSKFSMILRIWQSYLMSNHFSIVNTGPYKKKGQINYFFQLFFVHISIPDDVGPGSDEIFPAGTLVPNVNAQFFHHSKAEGETKLVPQGGRRPLHSWWCLFCSFLGIQTDFSFQHASSMKFFWLALFNSDAIFWGSPTHNLVPLNLISDITAPPPCNTPLTPWKTIFGGHIFEMR